MVDLIEELKDRGVFEWAESGTPQCLFFIFPVIIFEGRMYAAKYPPHSSKPNGNKVCLLFVHLQIT